MSTGKDVTLTGRTDLWAVAFQEIAERPVLGTGFQAFWVQGNPLAEELWAMFGIDSRSGFHFHNTLLSNAVEIGIVGVALQAVVFFGGLGASLVWAIRSPSGAWSRRWAAVSSPTKPVAPVTSTGPATGVN